MAAVVATPSTAQTINFVPQERKAKGEETERPSFSEIRVSEYGTVDIVVQNDDVVNVLQKLAIQARRNIVPSPAVHRMVNATIHGVPLLEAIEGLLNPNGLGFIERGEFIYVYTAEELSALHLHLRRQVSMLIHLNYLRASDGVRFARPLLSPDGSIDAIEDRPVGNEGNSAAEAVIQQVTDARAGTLGEDSQLDRTATRDSDQYALINAVIVHDYPENAEEIESFLMQMDTKPEQVLLEASILQTSLTEENALGTDFALVSDIGFETFFNFPSAGVPLDVKTSLTDQGNRSSPPAGDFVISNPGNTGNGDATFRLGVTAGDFGIFFRALDRVTDVTMLSNPKVITLNRQPARVHIGKRVGYLETVIVENQVLQTVKFIDTGIQLEIRPFVLHDGRVRLQLSPTLSDVTFRQVPGIGGSIQEIPDEQIETVVTDIVVPEGYTAVIGGLFREDTARTRSQVPVAGDIPLLGAAFRGQDDEVERFEVIFLIKPTVLKDNLIKNQGIRAEEHGDHVRVGTRLGLLPWSRERQTARLNLDAERLAREGSHSSALWKIRRSLELHPLQPDMIRLRERLVTDPVRTPSRSALKRIIDNESRQVFDVDPANDRPLTFSESAPTDDPGVTDPEDATAEPDELQEESNQ